jgi:hypothetical protein
VGICVERAISNFFHTIHVTSNLAGKRVSFEAEKVTDVVIDQDTLDLTCINGPQWFDRDFKENAGEKTEVAAAAEHQQLPNEAKPRKKPDPLRDSPDMNESLALLFQRLGLAHGNGGHAGNGEAAVPSDCDRMSQN